MIELKTEIIENKFIKHYAVDAEGNRYYILQVDTGIEYDEAIDLLPCRHTYSATDKKVEEPLPPPAEEEVPNDEV